MRPLEIRAIEVTDNATGDTPMLPCMLDQITDDDIIESVSGEGDYDTKRCHDAIAQRWHSALWHRGSRSRRSSCYLDTPSFKDVINPRVWNKIYSFS
ncbi:hypothetical protein GCM10011572_51730 [Pseudoduganella buxea]|uniref:Transposase n=1 Tax=Pseudoduganella buxea TaxID=1949069 RepID=A0ABQ1LFR1_9BURK|nr:hypothetical protein GCM10011572_51730 [Pseudoduganella buxea]